MNEEEFWFRLGYRVSSELSQFDDNDLRFLWCDGFEPSHTERDETASYVTGRVSIGNDRGGMEYRRFELVIGGPEVSRDGVDWLAVLPTEDETGWLAVREWGVEIVPPSVDAVRRSGAL